MNSKGKCLCGSVAWEITAEPFQAFNCHCKMCRKAHGSAFGTYWFLSLGETFQCIVMTGNAFQTVLSRKDQEPLLASVGLHLALCHATARATDSSRELRACFYNELQ